MAAQIPRKEFPRPQLYRGSNSWLNLNGQWDFEFDHGESGTARRLFDAGAEFKHSITVPFCPESKLSGIQYTDFMRCVWYRRSVALRPEWDVDAGRVLLHFGAVDYFAQVWIDSEYVGGHKGGYVSFQLDITPKLRDLKAAGKLALNAGVPEFRLTVRAEDNIHSPLQPSGKQCYEYYSHGCSYTRTTGIWQTVWLEYVPEHYIRNLFITPDVDNGKVSVRIRPGRYFAPGSVLRLSVYDCGGDIDPEGAGGGESIFGGQCTPGGERIFGDQRTLGDESIFDGQRVTGSQCVTDGNNPGSASVLRTVSGKAHGGETELTVPMPDVRLWEPCRPYLYGLVAELIAADGTVDRVYSYFGMRSVEVTPRAILINGKPVFQRLILDQGFYPDGVYTAPSDAELKADIERSMAYGFNGARLHQKVFEQRFLYWADRLGYLCWGEHANWGYDVCDPATLHSYVNEWSEIVERDYSNPSIIGWCPFNETGKGDVSIGTIYRLTKRLDPSRPVIDTSGWFHYSADDGTSGTDVYDFHDYEQNVAEFVKHIAIYGGNQTPPLSFIAPQAKRLPDTPLFCSEFGGTRWAEEKEGWGYGVGPASESEFAERFGQLVTTLLNDPDICAFCYTQLTDVEQEKNGLYTYDRKAKFPHETLRKYVEAKAAIEE